MAKDPTPAQSGSVTTTHLEGTIIETVYRGYITVPMVEDVRNGLIRLLAIHPRANWLIDTTEATGLAPAPRELTTGVLELFRERGGQRIAAVVKSGPIRMIATTFAFAFGMPMKSFERRADALVYLRQG